MPKRVLTASAAIFVALTVLLPLLGGNTEPLRFLIAAVAAFALIMGTWLAPATSRQGASGSLVGSRDPWRPALINAKVIQLLVGAAVVLGGVALFRSNPGTAAIFGIAAALAVPAVLPDRDADPCPRA